MEADYHHTVHNNAIHLLRLERQEALLMEEYSSPMVEVVNVDVEYDKTVHILYLCLFHHDRDLCHRRWLFCTHHFFYCQDIPSTSVVLDAEYILLIHNHHDLVVGLLFLYHDLGLCLGRVHLDHHVHLYRCYRPFDGSLLMLSPRFPFPDSYRSSFLPLLHLGCVFVFFSN